MTQRRHNSGKNRFVLLLQSKGNQDLPDQQEVTLPVLKAEYNKCQDISTPHCFVFATDGSDVHDAASNLPNVIVIDARTKLANYGRLLLRTNFLRVTLKKPSMTLRKRHHEG